MLEFDQAVKQLRLADCPRPMHLRGAARAAHRVPGSERCREDDRDACRVRAAAARRGHGQMAWLTDRRGRPCPFRVHARGTRPLPADAGPRAAGLPRPSCAGAPASRWARVTDLWLERAGGRGTGDSPGGRAVPWQPAAGATGRRPGQRTGPPGARRALLRPRPDRDGRHGGSAPGAGRTGRRQCCSPATSSTSSRTFARTSSSSTTDASYWPASFKTLRAATPQRVVDIRYRGPAPEWTGLPQVQVLENTGRSRSSSRSPATPRSRRWSRAD